MLDNATGEWLAWEGSGDYGDLEHGGAIDGAIDAAAAGIGAEAVHLRARVRSRASRRRRCCPTCRRRFRPAKTAWSTAAQLRRPVSRPAAGAPRAGRIGERAGGRARGARRRAEPAALPAHRGLQRPSTGPPRTTGSASRSATPKSGSTNWSPPTRRSPAAASPSCRASSRTGPAPSTASGWSPSAPRSGLPTSSPTTSAGVRVRPRRQPRVSVSRGGEDRDVAGVSRQLDHRLHARGHRRRLGRQLRSASADRIVRRHRRRPDLPRDHARGGEPRRPTTSSRRRPRRRPERVARQPICALSGMPASPRCPVQIERVDADGRGRPLHLAPTAPSHGAGAPSSPGRRNMSSGPGSPAPRRRRRRRVDRAAAPALRVVNPPEGATYLIDPTLRREFQTLPLRAAAGPTAIEWRVDGEPVGRAASDAPSPGRSRPGATSCRRATARAARPTSRSSSGKQRLDAVARCRLASGVSCRHENPRVSSKSDSGAPRCARASR